MCLQPLVQINNIFGNTLGNTQQFTGSVSVTGSLTVNGVMSLNNDGTYGSAYKTLGFTGNTNGSHRIFAGTSDDMFFAAATGRGLDFRVSGSANSSLYIAATGAATFSGTLAVNNEGIIINRSAGNGYLIFQTGGTDVGSIYSNTGGGIRLRNATSDVLTIASTGVATFSGSLRVGGAEGNFLIDSYTTTKIGVRSWTNIAGTTNNFFVQLIVQIIIMVL